MRIFNFSQGIQAKKVAEVDSESLPSCSEMHSRSSDMKSSPCEKLEPKEEPDASPPSPRTLLALQAALLGGSSEDELESETRRLCHVTHAPATARAGSVSPLTLLAMQRALDDDDEDVKVRASDVQTGGAGARKPKPLQSSSDEETEEGPKMRDGEGVPLAAASHAASMNLAEEPVTSADADEERTESAHLPRTVFCQGSDSGVPKEQMSFIPPVKEAFQTNDETALKDGKDPVPLENIVVLPRDAPGLQRGPEWTPTPPTSPSSVSRSGTKVLELQQDLLPPESKYDTSVLSSHDATESEKNPAPEGPVSLQESSDTLSVPLETISDLGNVASVNAREHENFLKTVQEHETIESAGQGLISVPASMEPKETGSEESESDGKCLCSFRDKEK